MAAVRPTAVGQRDSAAVESPRGTITVLIGCMFSGKTTLMLRRLEHRATGTIAAFKHAVDDRYAPGEVVAHGGARIAARAVESFDEIDRYLSNGAAGRIHAVAIDEGHFFTSSYCLTPSANVTSPPYPNARQLRAAGDATGLRYERKHQTRAAGFSLRGGSTVDTTQDQLRASGSFADGVSPFVAGVTSLADRGLDVYVTMLDRDCWGRVISLARKLNHVCDEIVLMHASCGHCGRPASRTQRLTPIVSGHLVGGPEHYEARCLECWRPPPETPPAID